MLGLGWYFLQPMWTTAHGLEFTVNFSSFLRSISMLKPGWLLKYCLETGLQKNRPLGHMWASQPNDLIQPYQLSDINGNWKSYNYCSIVSNAPFIGANFECSWLKIKGILTVWNKKQYRQRECTSCSLWEKKLIFVCHCQLILSLEKFLEGAEMPVVCLYRYTRCDMLNLKGAKKPR